MSRHFQSAGRTEVGKARRRNEDAILVREEAGLWVVADGLGGHAAGDHASRLIVERLAKVPRPDDVAAFIDAIEDTLIDVNDELRRTARQRGVDLIASTVVLLVQARDYALCGWAGDSRAYRCGNGRLVQVTRDHLYGGEDDDRWTGGPTQAQPGGGVLTRAVGADASLFVDWAVAGNGPGTWFVLCSDGINKEMSDAEIEAACARHTSPAALLDDVFETCLNRAARDNLSAVVVRLHDRVHHAPVVDARLHDADPALRALDEAHRLGRLARDDYRAQRRRLLETLADGNGHPDHGSRPPRKAGLAALARRLLRRH